MPESRLRREFLSRIAGIGAVTAIAGCSELESDQAGLHIYNHQASQHRVSVEITDTETASAAYEDTFDMAGNEDLAISDVVGEGEYDVQTVIDGEQELSKTITVVCTTTLIIAIREPGNSRISGPDCG